MPEIFGYSPVAIATGICGRGILGHHVAVSRPIGQKFSMVTGDNSTEVLGRCPQVASQDGLVGGGGNQRSESVLWDVEGVSYFTQHLV